MPILYQFVLDSELNNAQKISLINKVSSIFFIILITLSCSNTENSGSETQITPADNPVLPERGFYMGILPTTALGQDFDSSYPQAAQYVEFAPVWGRGTPDYRFWDFADDLNGSWRTLFVDDLIRGNNMFPVIHFSFITNEYPGGPLALQKPDNMPEATLDDPTWRELYRESILKGLRGSRPKYLSIGNEVNRWYEQFGADDSSHNGFQHFVSLYEEIYDTVKQVSPQTLVFCVFAREIVEQLREADLDVLNMFNPEKLDLLVFTSYPNTVKKDDNGDMLTAPINRPSDIPVDYYSRIMSYMPAKQFGFSEIAWPSENYFGGEQDQADFIDLLIDSLTMTRGIDLRLLGWPWLHNLEDPNSGSEESTGLIYRNGTEKTAYNNWKNLSLGTGK